MTPHDLPSGEYSSTVITSIPSNFKFALEPDGGNANVMPVGLQELILNYLNKIRFRIRDFHIWQMARFDQLAIIILARRRTVAASSPT